MKNQIFTTITKAKQSIIMSVCNNRGDFYISDAVRIVLAVVLGALLLAALVLIFNTTVIPKVTAEIEALFS